MALPLAGQERIIAIGDVHGAYPQFVGILQRTGLVDHNLQWVGGSAILIQSGDVPSRGPRTRDCLELLMDLERQAVKHHGRVLPLLGNHEVMTMMGDLRYVTPEDYQAFARQNSEKVRMQAYEEYRSFLRSRNSRHRSPPLADPTSRQKWMNEHPLGFFELRDAYGPEGPYGRWFRQHDAVAQIGDVIFLHGGLDPTLHVRGIRALNERVRQELARFDSLWRSLARKQIIWRYLRLEEATQEAYARLSEMDQSNEQDEFGTRQEIQELLNFQNWMIASPRGPLWYRGYAQEPEDKLAPALETVLAQLKVRHIVVAHTITDSRRITPRSSNRVFLIDTAMMLEAAHQGRASALEIRNETFTAYYGDGEQQVLLAPEGGGTAPALCPSREEGKQLP